LVESMELVSCLYPLLNIRPVSDVHQDRSPHLSRTGDGWLDGITVPYRENSWGAASFLCAPLGAGTKMFMWLRNRHLHLQRK
jgi:hypothetical protein